MRESKRRKRQRQRRIRLIFTILCVVLAALITVLIVQGVSARRGTQKPSNSAALDSSEALSEEPESASSQEMPVSSAESSTDPESVESSQVAGSDSGTEEPGGPEGSSSESSVESVPEESVPEESEPSGNGHYVAIDAGHEAVDLLDTEPNAPGSSEMKQKVSSGTYGEWSHLEEYELNLIVALKVRDILEARGYQVFMTRTTHDVQLSNIDRALMANESGAEIMVRIHANSVDNSEVYGALTYTAASDNPYLSEQLIADSYRLSEDIINCFCEVTGAKNRGILTSNTLTGINWTEIPCTYVEMGFMSNPDEDLLMATEDYQNRMAEGIADGIDRYFGLGG